MSSYRFEPHLHAAELLPLLQELLRLPLIDDEILRKTVKRFPKADGSIFSKHQLIQGYRYFVEHGELAEAPHFIEQIKMKPVRTGSGVTPVTVLTKPFPCPGKCIFCPNDIRMPKSYLHDEPGAQRAERNQFDPYLQTMSRLQAFRNIGHLTQKVEIIILGGTWSFYPESYQIWFVRRCFEALNDFSLGVNQVAGVEAEYQEKLEKLGVASRTQNMQVDEAQLHGHDLNKTYNQVISEIYTAPEKLLQLDEDQHSTWEELFAQHRVNETADCRCVGLVIETRPDYISESEVIRIRKLGCTKTQIGFQSLNDEVLEKNHRGHDVAATRQAVRLLRQMGLKIHGHWMPNLYGSSPELDVEDYQKMFADPDFKPDELKVYPCSLIESAELMSYYQRGEWRPYNESELLEVLVKVFELTPEYCRLTRVIRDIPSTDIVVGNKKTNFREIVERELKVRNIRSKDIRSREIKQQIFDKTALQLSKVAYSTSVADEQFLQYVTDDHKIAGFLRISLPTVEPFLPELSESAMIREVHVYGSTTAIGTSQTDRAQHVGLGKRLIQEAIVIASEKGYKKLQVISAVGTREYYRKFGFQDGELYQYYQL